MLGSTINLNTPDLISIFRALLLALAILYFFFSLIVVRQVNLMTESLQTEVSPIFKVFAIVFAVISLAVVIYFVNLLS